MISCNLSFNIYGQLQFRVREKEREWAKGVRNEWPNLFLNGFGRSGRKCNLIATFVRCRQRRTQSKLNVTGTVEVAAFALCGAQEALPVLA